MNEFNSVIAGFGGQGVLFLGKVLAYIGLMNDKEVSWLPSYGPEMRGGTANCSVCISDEPIGSPLVLNPNVFIAMNGPSFDKFINTVAPGGKVFIDSTLISRKVERDDVIPYYVPATKLADENGLKGGANMVLLGKIFKETGFCSEEALKLGIQKCIPPRKADRLESNLKAISLGISY